MSQRTNEEWLSALREPVDGPAVDDLRAVLLRGLRAGLRTQGAIADTDLEDFAQDALLKILNSLESFRGESRFTTWAQKIAIRVALTELRRLRWKDRSLDELIEGPNQGGDGGSDYTPAFMADTRASPEQEAIRQSMIATVQRAMAEQLTNKQQQAMMAVRVQGMPLEEVARRMGTNRNSLYKLLHDARQRLKKVLIEQGISADEILAAFETG